VCFIYVLPFLVPFLIQCLRLMSHNKDLLTYIFVGFAEEKIEVCKTKAEMHFIGRDIAGLGQNIDFQPQKVGGQRIGFVHKD